MRDAASLTAPAAPTAPWLDPWAALRHAPTQRLTHGLIHETWRVGCPPLAVVQRVSQLFADDVHSVMDAITQHLAARGLCTPALVRTDEGALFASDPRGDRWRALTWVEGETLTRLTQPAQVASASELVARWHLTACSAPAARGWATRARLSPRDQLDALREAVARHAAHPLAGRASALAGGIFDAAIALPSWALREDTHEQIVGHGDLKITNIRFDARGAAVALLDLDTVGISARSRELGDAWRSWCNPAGEDDARGELDLELLRAAALPYLERVPLTDRGRAELCLGPERIAVELAARFCRDALEEQLFGWDPSVAPTRAEHNLLRAEGQLSLARSACAQRPEVARLLSVQG